MRRNLLALSIVTVLTLVAGSAYAFSPTMHITVPFDFYVGSEQFPAGDYSFEMKSGTAPTGSFIAIKTKEGVGVCLLLTQPGVDSSFDKLLFNKYGNKHFLSSISMLGYKAGVRMQKLERELRAQTLKSQSITIVAQK